jgi:hypothetical protein
MRRLRLRKVVVGKRVGFECDGARGSGEDVRR